MTTLYSGLTSTVPVSMVPVSRGNLYVVNGVQRGVVVVGGTTAYPIGVTAAASITASSTNSPQYYYVASIEATTGGENYNSPPSVTISGVSGARALLDGSQVVGITFTTSANTFTTSPAVVLTGGQASNASAKAVVRGNVAAVNVYDAGAYYSTPPAVSFAAATGVTEVRAARGRAALVYNSFAATTGRIASIIITDQGQYEWDSATLGNGVRPVSATVAAGSFGVTATLTVDCAGAVASVAAVSGGTAYSTPPTVSFLAQGPLKRGAGASALASVTGGTVVSYALITYGNGYDGAVGVTLASDQAAATAILAPRLAGKYLCGVRLVGRDGVPGNFCGLITVDCGERASSIVWDLSSITLTDGSPNRVAKVELWRTSGDQAVSLYKVTEFTAPPTSHTDSLTDSDLTNPDRVGYDAIRILTEDGLTNAFRFGVPPSNMSVVTMFQDRAWYAVDTSGSEANTLYFSEVDEPESVAADAQVVIQTNGRDGDAITGLMPLDGVMYVGQKRNIVRLVVDGSPYTGASATQVAQRGLLNDRCWDRFEDTAYIVDSAGLYAFKGSGAEPLSDPVGDYWDKPLIDFSKSRWFFVQVNGAERVVRFYFVRVGSAATYPNSALCYSLVTKAWWIESYARELSAKVTLEQSGRQVQCVGANQKLYRTSFGATDDGSAISYSLKTGNFPLNNDPKRNLRLTYTPVDSTVAARLYYNNAASPRVNAVATNRGDGFVTTTGSTQATLSMAPSRSPLGPATGFAQLSLSGRMDDRSAGGDRVVATELAGTRGSTAPVIHGLEIEGAG
jgi:hypothetical protein